MEGGPTTSSVYGVEREHEVWVSGAKRHSEARERVMPVKRLDQQLLAVTPGDPRVARLLAESGPKRQRSVGCYLVNGALFQPESTGIPEYAGPECATPTEATLADAAGRLILQELLQAFDRENDLKGAVRLIRNNSGPDQSLHSMTCGTDENYRVPAEVAWRLGQQWGGGLAAHLATRGIYAGAGEVRAATAGYALTARARYMRNPVGSGHGDSDRAMIKITGSHYDQPGFARLQVASGDTTMSPWSTFANLGPTSLVVAAYEHPAWQGRVDALALFDPVQAMQYVSRDANWDTRKVGQSLQLEWLNRSGTVTALAHQVEMFTLMSAFVAETGGGPGDAAESLRLWEYALNALEHGGKGLERVADVFIKRQMLEDVVLGLNPQASGHLLRARDIQYHDLSPTGIYNALVRHGRVDEGISADDVAALISNPPSNTRARVRAAAIRHTGDEEIFASWSGIASLKFPSLGVSFGSVGDGSDKEVNRVLHEVDMIPAICGASARWVGPSIPRPEGPAPPLLDRELGA